MPKLSDNQIGDGFMQRAKLWGPRRAKPSAELPPLSRRVRRMALLEQGLLIAAERNSDHLSTVINQPIVPPSK